MNKNVPVITIIREDGGKQSYIPCDVVILTLKSIYLALLTGEPDMAKKVDKLIMELDKEADNAR